MMALQEHSLYDDTPSHYGKPDNMYLNLKEGKRHTILNTPDVSVFALSTPEVQNILSTAGNATTVTSATRRTPTTPSSYGLLRGDHQVTVEQEYYAKGFLDRLEALQASDLHRNKNVNNPSVVSCSSVVDHTSSNHYSNGPNPSLEAVAPTYVTATLDHIPNFASATQTISESTSSYPMTTSHEGYYTHDTYTMPFRHETALLPGGYSMPAGGVTLPQPIMYGITDSSSHMNGNLLKEMSMVPDLHIQEQMKIERKKARNRIAASKCRSKRLQREADLQTKVKVLKEHNKELNDEVNGLKEQISNLKRALLQHMKTGCQVDLPENLSSRGRSESS